MRSLVKQRQKVWFCSVTEVNDGLDRKRLYSKPDEKRMTVSWGTGDMKFEGSGIVEDYDRQITCFDRSFNPPVGTMVYIDTVPSIDPITFELTEDSPKPDYIVVKIIDTKAGLNSRICVKKV